MKEKKWIYEAYEKEPGFLRDELKLDIVRILNTEDTWIFSLINRNGTEMRAFGNIYVVKYAEEDYEKVKKLVEGKGDREDGEYMKRYFRDYPVIAEIPLKEVIVYYPFAYDFLKYEIEPLKKYFFHGPETITPLMYWLLSARTEEEAIERFKKLYARAKDVRKEILLSDGRSLFAFRIFFLEPLEVEGPFITRPELEE